LDNLSGRFLNHDK